MRKLWLGGLLVLSLAAGGSIPADADGKGGLPVDLELVIAADVSTSMDRVEKDLQRDGFIAAFRDAQVHRAIALGPLGRIAVTYIEWGGSDRQRVVVPWTRIDSPEAARAFADRLAEVSPGRLTYGTNMGDAIVFGLGQLGQSGFAGTRKAIDISGDGKSNRGRPLHLARAAALARGVVINGLPIVYDDEAPETVSFVETPDGKVPPEELIDYFLQEVIGGPGAFVMPVMNRQLYGEAIRAKLVREIADGPMEPRFSAAPR
ncbi:hypothetical protein FHS55_000219 [Angulomicrobium tetraedrale]|uniref:DUF1194 domain-containing protein n=1 Tax=Ancylobacter tetraedralis TaxID=217068 RepID=A0A839Z3T7_9HYPH|nr:hypothetical protein [Ancylobacter tetraedralis]